MAMVAHTYNPVSGGFQSCAAKPGLCIQLELEVLCTLSKALKNKVTIQPLS